MNLGLGLALELQNGKFGSIYDGLIKSGATMILDPNRPTGKPFTKLSPRTLPNGVSNGELTPQRVSGDVVLQASDVTSIIVGTNATQASIPISVLDGIIGVGAPDTIGTKVHSSNSLPLSGVAADSTEGIGRHYLTGSTFRIILPPNTTLAQARTLLAGTVIRYQLATPIDTLNSPFVNPLVDLANKVGKNLFDWSKSIIGGYYSGTGSITSSATSFYNTEYIPVLLGQSYIANNNNASVQYVEYDSNKNFIQRLNRNASIPYIVGSGVSFIRISFFEPPVITIFTAQIELGTVATTYEPYAKNNALLQNFIPSSADGYDTIIAPNDSGANSVDVNQVVVNGDFANGTAGWIGENGSVFVSNKIAYSTASGAVVSSQIRRPLAIASIAGNKLFVKATVKVTNSVCSTIRVFANKTGGGSEVQIATISNPIQNTAYQIYGVAQLTGATGNIEIYVRHTYPDATTANGKVMEVDGNTGVFAIPMTGTPYENFTADQMNQLVSKGYFEGNKTIRYSTPTVLNLDGSNSFGALASSDDLNPIGTGDFVIADVIRTNVLKDQYLITKATSSEASTQYGVKITSTGNLVLILEGTSITLATGLLANTFYKILISRDNGTLRCELQGVQTYSQANTISLTAKANTLIGALSTIAGGTTQTGYANVSQGIKVFGKDHDFAKFKSEFYKLALKQYGL